nr:MAG TPA: hypothetical protein [Caudoviricetes sp.]
MAGESKVTQKKPSNNTMRNIPTNYGRNHGKH